MLWAPVEIGLFIHDSSFDSRTRLVSRAQAERVVNPKEFQKQDADSPNVVGFGVIVLILPISASDMLRHLPEPFPDLNNPTSPLRSGPDHHQL